MTRKRYTVFTLARLVRPFFIRTASIGPQRRVQRFVSQHFTRSLAGQWKLLVDKADFEVQE